MEVIEDPQRLDGVGRGDTTVLDQNQMVAVIFLALAMFDEPGLPGRQRISRGNDKFSFLEQSGQALFQLGGQCIERVFLDWLDLG